MIQLTILKFILRNKLLFMIFIIIPTYNRQNTISRAINSCLKQKWNFKIIIIDDGSTDDSKTIVDKFITKNANRIIYYYKENWGVCSAVNAWIEIAIKESHWKDDYILPLWSDDELIENCIIKIQSDINQYQQKILFYQMISEDWPITNFLFEKCICNYDQYLQHEPMYWNDACVVCSINLLNESWYRLPNVFSWWECYPYFKLMFKHFALFSKKQVYKVHKDVLGLTRSKLQYRDILNLIKLYNITLRDFSSKRKEVGQNKYFGLSYLILSRSYWLLWNKIKALKYIIIWIYYSPLDIKRIIMAIIGLLPRSLKITNWIIIFLITKKIKND